MSAGSWNDLRPNRIAATHHVLRAGADEEGRLAGTSKWLDKKRSS